MMRIALIFIGVLIASSSFGQQRAAYSNFMLNDYYYNPAIAGSKNVHIANASFRKQWVGFDGSPTLIMANFYGSVRNRGKVGYGVSIVSEQTGITQNTGIYLNYAHHFKLGEKLKLGLGIKPGWMQYRVKLYDAQVADKGDEVLTGNVYSASAFDLSAGFNLYTENFFFMASAHHMLGDAIKFTTYNENLEFHYNAILGYSFQFKKKNFELQPSVMVKYTKPVPLQVTGMLKATFNKKYWVGLLYRSDDAIGISAGIMLKERFGLAYGYDYTISKLRNYTSGSHEVMLTFVITKNKPSLEEEDEDLNNSILEEMQRNMEEQEQNN
ncbi:MAG: type IX secretion system membrane protein PorP/SprF [Crocinitomicaceae bacterium]|nr:type IX secretion system membrane protein PorP/SprF [Crocinitomicaceae bacterium]